MLRNHYIQKAKLDNFAYHDKGKKKINLIDVQHKVVGWRNTERAYYEKGLYSVDLESKLNQYIEIPALEIFRKIANSKKEVVLKRSELETVKKYLLIQRYRTPGNIDSYRPDHERDILGFNKSLPEDGEGYRKYVYRIMSEILETPWKELLKSENMEIYNNVMSTQESSTLFFRTEQEFVLNDCGNVTERHHREPTGSIKNSEMVEFLKAEFKKWECVVSEKDLIRFVTMEQYYDNYEVFPITSELSVVLVDRIWTRMLKSGRTFDDMRKMGLYSEFLEKFYKSCTQNYVNYEKIYEPILKSGKTEDSVKKFNDNIFTFWDPNDEFIYPVQVLDRYWTAYINGLMMNEAEHYIGFKTFDKVKDSIYQYNDMGKKGVSLKNDLNWINDDTDWSKPLR